MAITREQVHQYLLDEAEFATGDGDPVAAAKLRAAAVDVETARHRELTDQTKLTDDQPTTILDKLNSLWGGFVGEVKKEIPDIAPILEAREESDR